MNRKRLESLILKSFISTAVVFSAAVAIPNFGVNKNCNSSLITTSKVYAAANISQDNQTVTLILTFVDDTSKTYKISQDEFNDFIGWYTAEAEGESDQPEYTFKGQDTEDSKPIKFSRISSVETE